MRLGDLGDAVEQAKAAFDAGETRFRLGRHPRFVPLAAAYGVGDDVIRCLSLLGISGICNLLAAIKTARYFELEANDVIVTTLTDSVELYRTRLTELRKERGAAGGHAECAVCHREEIDRGDCRAP